MNIIITGAGGQLGTDCLGILTPDHSVHGYSSSQLDITQYDRVQQEVEKNKPDVIINCAAYTAVDACEKDSTTCHAVNRDGPFNLARACKKTGCRLIHISTDYVFDGNKPAPQAYTEQDAVAPLSAYGRSKLAGEQAITTEMDNFLILRTAWLYGIGGNNFLKTMLRLALTDATRTIRVVNDQHGSLTWTMTLARQIAALLTTDLCGIAHATAHGTSTWYEGARFFLEAMQVHFLLEPCTSDEYPTPAHRPHNSILANTCLQNNNLDIMEDWKKDITTFVNLNRQALLDELAPSGSK